MYSRCHAIILKICFEMFIIKFIKAMQLNAMQKKKYKKYCIKEHIKMTVQKRF